MIAIYGIWGDSDLGELQQMGRRLDHRGPLVSEWTPDPQLRLGFRTFERSLLPSRELAVTAQGTLYNTDELGLPPHSKIGITGQLLEVWRRWQVAGFRRCRGGFAGALLCEQTDHLVLFRDQYGAQTLYYARHKDRILFASEYKAFLALEDFPAEPDLDTLQKIHQTMSAKQDAACLKGVRPVPPATAIKIDRSMHEDLDRQRYWTPEIDLRDQSVSGWKREIRTVLLDVMQRQTADAESIGIALSGGLDSTLLLGVLHKVAPKKKIHTFTAGFGKDDPEVQAARQAAEYFEVPHHVVTLEAEDLPGLLETVIWHIEDPVGREDNPYLYRTVQEASGKVEVLLSGYGGDNLFGGMPRHQVLNLGMRLAPLRSALADFYNFSQTGQEPATLLGSVLIRTYFRGKSFPPAQLTDSKWRPERTSIPSRAAEGLNHCLLRSIQDYPGKLQVEKLHSAFQLRFSAPMTDPRFIELAFQVPQDLKIRFLQPKYILREAVREFLPESLLRKKKTLQRMRHGKDLSDVTERLAAEVLTREAVGSRAFLDYDYVAAAKKRVGDAPYPTGQFYRLWSLLLIEMWARIFLDRRGQAPVTSVDPALEK